MPGDFSRRAFLQSAATLALSPRLLRAAGPQFSLAHLTILGSPPPKATEIAARCGYDFVSLRLIDMKLPGEPVYDLAHDPAMLRETKAALDVSGLMVHDIEVARIAAGVDVAGYAPLLETGAELGARCVICSVWSTDRGYTRDSLGKLCDLAAKAGLAVSLEFVTWSGLPNLREAVALVRSLRRDNLGLLIDVLHFDRSHVKVEELDSIPRTWFHFAHVNDAPKADGVQTTESLIHTAREARLDPGAGAIDIAGILRHLPAIPYSLEIPNLERVKELGAEEHARRCLIAAKSYFAAHSQ